MKNKAEDKEKEGVVPAEQISGSDADKAYAKAGDGKQEKGVTDLETSTPDGSDADSEE